MVVAIRLARYGRRHAPYYRIMVADSRRARDGKFIEHVGAYDPLIDAHGAKHLRLNTERITYWLSVGAQPSDTVARLLEKANILPPRPRYSDVPALPTEINHKPSWLATNAAPQKAQGETALPSVNAQEWWKMVRGKHVPGLAGANEFHIDSPLQAEVLAAAGAPSEPADQIEAVYDPVGPVEEEQQRGGRAGTGGRMPRSFQQAQQRPL